MKNASYYLIRKCGKKGTEIEYSCLQMADYLQPFCADLTIEQKSEMFAVRNWIIQIDYNFSKNNLQTKCWCNDNEDMRHIIYQCELLSDTNNERKISTLRKNPRPYSKCLFGVCLMGEIILNRYQPTIQTNKQIGIAVLLHIDCLDQPERSNRLTRPISWFSVRWLKMTTALLTRGRGKRRLESESQLGKIF